jgi:hypothetical protein
MKVMGTHKKGEKMENKQKDETQARVRWGCFFHRPAARSNNTHRDARRAL